MGVARERSLAAIEGYCHLSVLILENEALKGKNGFFFFYVRLDLCVGLSRHPSVLQTALSGPAYPYRSTKNDPKIFLIAKEIQTYWKLTICLLGRLKVGNVSASWGIARDWALRMKRWETRDLILYYH